MYFLKLSWKSFKLKIKKTWKIFITASFLTIGRVYKVEPTDAEFQTQEIIFFLYLLQPPFAILQ